MIRRTQRKKEKREMTEKGVSSGVARFVDY